MTKDDNAEAFSITEPVEWGRSVARNALSSGLRFNLTHEQFDIDDIHLWSFSVPKLRSRLQYFTTLLSADERARASHFQFANHRTNFIVGRGMLRLLLSTYVCIRPRKLRFRTSEYGRPELLNTPIGFNTSHSGNQIAYVIAREPMIGVDIEVIRQVPEMTSIAKAVFSPAQYHDLLTCSNRARLSTFYKIWTRHESYLKALGVGLRTPRCQVDRAETSGDSGWSLINYRPTCGYVGCVAAYGKERSIIRGSCI